MTVSHSLASCVPKRVADVQQPDARVYNMGGPQRMSRVDMAEAVTDARGYDRAAILRAPAASVDRGVASPADISMNTALLQVGTTPYARWDPLA